MPKPTSHRQYVSGKGSWRREAQVPAKQFEENWDEIFGKKAPVSKSERIVTEHSSRPSS